MAKEALVFILKRQLQTDTFLELFYINSKKPI